MFTAGLVSLRHADKACARDVIQVSSLGLVKRIFICVLKSQCLRTGPSKIFLFKGCALKLCSACEDSGAF